MRPASSLDTAVTWGGLITGMPPARVATAYIIGGRSIIGTMGCDTANLGIDPVEQQRH
jgi:hypothetical protein